jgi:hypothetical protein
MMWRVLLAIIIFVMTTSSLAQAQSLESRANPLQHTMVVSLDTSPNAVLSWRAGLAWPQLVAFSGRTLSPRLGSRLSLATTPNTSSIQLDALVFWPSEPLVLHGGLGLMYRNALGTSLSIGATAPVGAGLGITAEANWTAFGDITAHLGFSYSFSWPSPADTASNP